MKSLLTLACLLISVSLHAMTPEYFSSRKWVEDNCGTNQISSKQRIFVGRPSGYAGILRYRKGITLRGIINQTPFKAETNIVVVLRPKENGAGSDLFRMTVLPAETPAFTIQNMDMLWLYKDSIVPLW